MGSKNEKGKEVLVSESELLNGIEKFANIKHAKKRLFLEKYTTFGDISHTAEATGVHRTTVHHWLNNDVDFETVFGTVRKVAESELLERHLKNIRDIAFDPNVKDGNRLIASFFEVKKLDPTYRDRQIPSISIGDIRVISLVPRPEYIEGEYEEIEPNAVQVSVETPKEIEQSLDR